MEQVLEHLNLLYHKGHQDTAISQNIYQDSDRFLEKFQRSTEAWDISIQMLAAASIPEEFRVFAAQSLKRKVVNDLAQLDFNELASMKETVLLLLKSFKNAPNSLLNQAFLAVVYLAMQIDPAIWTDPIGDILNIYNDGFIELKGLIIFLTLFPYECKHSQVALDVGQEENIRSIQSMYVIKILSFLFEIGNSQGWTKDLLDCLFYWIKYAVKSEQECIRCLNTLPLLDLAFSGLKSSLTSSECAPVCCEIINEIIFKTSNIANLSSVIPMQVFKGLQENFKLAQHALREEDEDFVLSWIDLCSEFCWSCEELMEERSEVFIVIMDMILALSTPQNILIMERSFSYWEGIVGIFDRVPNINSNVQIMERIENFFCILLQSTELPSDLEGTSHSSQQYEDWNNYCQTANELLSLYSAEVLPETRTVQLMVRYATSSRSTTIILNAINSTRAIARNLQEPTLILNTLYSLLSDKECILAYVKLLAKITHFDMVGRELELIKCCLDDHQLFQEAILALKNIFSQCASTISPQVILQWIGVLTEKSGHMPKYVQLDVCGCMASLLSRVPEELNVQVYRSLIKDIIVRINVNDAQDCLEAMEKIVSVLKNATPSHHISLSHVLMEQWSLFQQISDNFGAQVNVMESVARVLKYLVICNNALLVTIIDFSVHQFSLHFLSWPVYLLRFFLREFCSNQTMLATITGSVNKISVHLFATSSRIEEISDVFVDFFKLLSLHTTITSVVEWHCFDLGLSCLAGSPEWIPYSDVIGAVLTYLVSSIKCIRGKNPTQAEIQIASQKISTIFTDGVLFRILYGVLLEYPSSLVYPVAELLNVLCLLHEPLAARLLVVLQSVLADLPHFSIRERERQMERFGQVLNRHNLDDLESLLYSLSKTSQRRLT